MIPRKLSQFWPTWSTDSTSTAYRIWQFLHYHMSQRQNVIYSQAQLISWLLLLILLLNPEKQKKYIWNGYSALHYVYSKVNRSTDYKSSLLIGDNNLWISVISNVCRIGNKTLCILGCIHATIVSSFQTLILVPIPGSISLQWMSTEYEF